MRWTGVGWLAPVLFVLACFGGGPLVDALTPDGFPVLGSVAIAMLLGAVVHWALARALNSTSTPPGRVWHDTHTYFGAPLQQAVGLYLLVALVAGSVAVGEHRSPAVGWATFLGLPVAVLLVRPLARRVVGRP
jgi:hypothetical protein